MSWPGSGRKPTATLPASSPGSGARSLEDFMRTARPLYRSAVGLTCAVLLVWGVGSFAAAATPEFGGELVTDPLVIDGPTGFVPGDPGEPAVPDSYIVVLKDA